MTIKKLEGKERFEAYKLFIYCFHQRVENPEAERQKRESEALEDWGSFDENNNLMARIINNHYDFYFDGKIIKTGGIGGVATYPEYRDTGAIRQIFYEILHEAYQNGEVLSSLYPFNHKFYRKFGYEVTPFRNEYKFSPSLLKDYHSVVCNNEKCKVTKWQSGQSVKAFLDIYNSFAPEYNLSAVRTEETMLNHLKIEKEYVDRKFSYIFSLCEKNIAYLIFTDLFSPEGATLKVEECAWTCKDGFNSILNFLSRFSADYRSIILPLPKGLDLLKIIQCPNAYEIEKKVCQQFMVRVVNVKKLFENIKKTEDCNFTVKVRDDLIKENNIALQILPNRVEILEEKTKNCKFDLELDVRALAQLAVGSANLDEALLRPDVTVNNKEEMLRRFFTEKKLFVSESF